jgi:hypothetical protein
MKPTLAGKPVPMTRMEMALAHAFRADRSGLVVGTQFVLRSYDMKLHIRWTKVSPANIGGVNISGDGRLVVAAYGDGTLRWHRWSDGQELLALFVDRETLAWVAWTPSGYYSASPGGENMIGWQLNRGWDQNADFFPASKFRDKYARPDVVERILDTLDEAEAVRQADRARPAGGASNGLIATLPPVVAIESPAEGAVLSEPTATVTYTVRSPSGVPVTKVGALVNGRPVGARGFVAIDDVNECLRNARGLAPIGAEPSTCRGSLTIPLPPGSSDIGVFAEAGGRASEIAKVRVRFFGGGGLAEQPKPRLYALLVGVSDYANPDFKLQFAAKDAQDFTAALANQKGGLYGDVVVRLLTDQQASKAAIEEGLAWVRRQVGANDIGLVFLSGHGVLDPGGRFYFLAADSDSARLGATAVPRDDLSDALDGLPGEALLFLDACHAAAVLGNAHRASYDFNAAVNDFISSERGIVIFAASTGRQLSLENSAWGNGAFTKALVEGLGLPGLRGKADLNNDGTITPALLSAFVAKRVRELTGGTQSPVMTSTAPDFPLALAR